MELLLAQVRRFLATAHRPLVVIVGPTASGKTDVSVALARRLSSDGCSLAVVNADSRQLYRHLTIGTAKITPEEMQGVPHHLLDVLDPKDPVTVAWYKERATDVIGTLQAQGNVPVLVGGSMLYVSAVIDGLEPLPAADPGLRAALEQAYALDGGKALYERLQAADPDLAAGIERRNKRYLVRALELIEQTGKTVSEQRRTSACPYDLFILGIRWPREELARRIDRRTGLLMERGWVEEVEALLGTGYTAADPGMQSHGYRELLGWVQRGKPGREQDGVRDGIAAQTRQYAKRQMTWWRNDPRIRWIAGEEAAAFRI